jgi:RimJ/RimL family protein N-acetyltransferase
MDPLLLDIPDEIVTERLVIRAPRPGDGEAVLRAVSASVDNLRRFPESMGWALAEPSAEASECFCEQSRADFRARRDIPLTLWSRDLSVVVGGAGLHRPDWSVPKFEIGWWGHTDHLGQGLISEAVRAILDFAFTSLGARRVEAKVG